MYVEFDFGYDYNFFFLTDTRSHIHLQWAIELLILVPHCLEDVVWLELAASAPSKEVASGLEAGAI